MPRIAAFAWLLLLAGAPALAQDWNGTGGNNNWSTAGNWVGGAAPFNFSNATVTFGAAGTTFTPAVDVPYSINRLDVAGATPYSFTGNIITFQGPNAALNVSGAVHAIANNLSFGTLTTVTTSSDLVYPGALAGGSGFIKAGAGRLALTSTNAFLGLSGPITINAGVLQLGDGTTSVPFVPPNTVDNATLELAGGLSPIAVASGLTGTGNVVVSSGRVDIFAIPMTHLGSTTLTGTALLTGTVTNNGRLSIAAGARADMANSTVGSLAGAGLLNVMGGAGFTVGGDGTTSTFSGSIAGSSPFLLTGPGRLILTNTNPLAGFGSTLTVSGGVLQLGDGTTAPIFLPPSVVDNGTIDFAAGAVPIAVASGLAGTGNVVVSAGRVDIFAIPMTHAGSTTVTGTALLTGRVTNNGALVIDAGARADMNNSIVGSLAGSGQLNILGPGITVGGDGTDFAFSGAVSGAALTKMGSGTFTFSGTHSGFGSTLVNTGALVLTGTMPGVTANVGATLGGTGIVAGPLVVNDGATLRIGIEGTTPVTEYDGLTVSGTVTISQGTLLLTGSFVPVVGNVFTIVNKTGAGAVTGTFAGLPEGGTLAFNGSTLRISYVGGTGNDITLTTIATTALAWNGAGANNNWSTAANWSGGVAPPSDPATFVAFPATSARFGPVVDVPWTINRMVITGASAYAISGQAITFAGTTPRLDGSGAAHTLANPLALSSTLAVSTTSAITVSGAIGGAGGLTKSGAGILTLSGAGTYAGATTVSAGTLLVDGSITGPVTVGAGGTLGGTGTIAGAVTISTGGTLAGGAPGEINVGSLTLSGALATEIQGTTLGTQYDSANVTGTVTIAGGALVLSGAYVPVAGNTFTLITNDGADAVVGTFTGLPEGATLAFNGTTLRISYVGGTGNDVVLTAVVLASTTWNGAGADPAWSTGGNWVGGVSPASASTTFVTFPAASARFGAQVDTPRTLNRMDISGATPYTIFGQPLTFDGAAPQLNVAGAVHHISNDLIIATPLAISTAVDLLYGGTLTGTGFTKAGSGRLTLNKPTAFAGFGPITIDAGVLRLGDGIASPVFLPPNAVNNATLEFAAGAPPIAVASGLTGTGNVVVSSGRVDIFAIPMTHLGSTTLTGTAVLTGTVTNNGRLSIAAGARADMFSSTFGSLAGAGLLNVFGTGITVGGDGTTTTFSGSIAGFNPFLLTGPGRLILNNTNPLTGFSSTFTVGGGVLQLGDGTTAPIFLPPNVVDNGTIDFAAGAVPIAVASGLTGTGNVVVSSGRVDIFAIPMTHAGSTTVTGNSMLTGTVTNNGALAIGAGSRADMFGSTVGSLAGAGLLNVFGAGITVGGDGTTTTFSGTIAGFAPFLLTGPGRLILTNTNSMTAFTNTLTVGGGALQLGDGLTAPMFLPPNVVDNGTIDFAGGLVPIGVPFGLTGTGDVVVSSGRVDNSGTAMTHAGSTTVTGSARLTGMVTNNGPLLIDTAARMDAFDSTVGSLTGAGLLNVFGAGITVGGDGTSTIFSGVVAGGGNLIKTGAGTLTLSGVNTNVGVMTINGGTLLLTGSSPGTVAVNAGGTFGGTGTVSGSVTVNAGGTLAPGLSPGIINTGNLNVAGVLAVEILGTAIGTQYDNTNVTGTVTIAGGTLSLTGAYVPLTGDVFTIVTNDLVDAVTGTFAGLPEGAPIVFNGSTLRISYVGGSGNDITLTAISTTTVVWNGAGANDNWSSGANWVTGFAPLSGATTFVTFPAASARFAPVADAPWTLNRMDLTGASAYAISGQAITFTGAAPQLNASGAAHAITNPLTLASALAVSNASTLTLSGPIGGGFTVTKSGAGTLLVNGTLTGSMTVAGGTLGGTGTIVGPVTVQAGATLAPGLSPGIINTGNLNLAGVALMEITGATLGTQFDNINVTGTVALGGTLTLAGAYVPVAGNTFTIISNDGADAVTGTFAGLVEGATVSFNGVTLRITYIGGTGNDVALVVVPAPAAVAGLPVPTLSEWTMILLAILMAGAGTAAIRRRSRAESGCRVRP